MKKSRGVMIAGNWKMNHGPVQTDEYFSSLRELTAPGGNFDQTGIRLRIYCPAVSFAAALTGCEFLADAVKITIEIGAQNAHWEQKGAFTGELSGPLLKEVGIETVLVGHSERRQYFGETDETVKKRAESLLAQGFEVILCIGETKAQRDAGKTKEVLTQQLKSGLPSKLVQFAKKLVVAYEPVWAIGTGVNATVEQAEEAHQIVRSFLPKEVPVLYGGSVTEANISELLECASIDGALVGGASLKAESYWKMIQAARACLG